MKKSFHAFLFVLLPVALLAQPGKYVLTGHIGNANAPGIAYLLYSVEGNSSRIRLFLLKEFLFSKAR